ncbi:sigma-70 family RNA polymerase sigma factor [Cupriavidus basilensis]|uniref:sigma-70 family RNA polymerase sigma factor n=1 Tax=Cupriavidus basilensis TaxID=68895 RepID=UPI0039F692CB
MPAGNTSLDLHSLYCDHHGWLHGWLRRKLGDAFDAADVAHDTFVRILVSGRTPSREQSRSHLTQIAKGLVIDLHRRRRLESAYLEALCLLPEPSAPSPEERAVVLELLIRIDAMLDDLPERVREAFLLSQLSGMTYSAIAEQLDVSVASVRKYMLRAIQACHAALGDA